MSLTSTFRWPVIIAIVVGSLIVLSILFCCIRCLCCGVECCCGICSCFNACCPSPRKRRDQGSYNNNPPYRSVGPPQPPYQAQYQSHAPPTYSSPSYNNAPGYNSGRPQYAQFDVSKPANPDALPSMPSWNHAENKKIEVFEDHANDVEMNDLDHNGHKPGTSGSQAPMLDGFAGAGAGGMVAHQQRPGMGSRMDSRDPYDRSPYGASSPHGLGPTSPYDERQSFMSAGNHPTDAGQYHPTDDAYGGAAMAGYRGAPPARNQYRSHYDDQPHSPYGSPPHTSPIRSQFSPHQYPQQQNYQQPPQQSYQAFSPHEGSGAAPAYPGQRSYQDRSDLRSPVSPVNAQGGSYGSYGQPHDGDNSEQYRPQQGWQGGVDRKPVNGSWRDI